MLSIGYHLLGKGYGVYAPLSNKYFNNFISKSRENTKRIYFLVLKQWNLFDKTRRKEIMRFMVSSMINPPNASQIVLAGVHGHQVPVFKGAENLAKEFNFLYTLQKLTEKEEASIRQQFPV